MIGWTLIATVFVTLFLQVLSETINIPPFKKLIHNYPGYKLFGGQFSHRKLLNIIACERDHLLRDTSALRLSLTLNKIGDQHSLGRAPIKLSKYGQDSVTGLEGLQYIYHPLAFGPFLVDRYGYPNTSVVHQTDPIATKDKFWGRQGIIEIITFTKRGNKPKGHIGLWDCDHFHQAKDWIGKRKLISVEFWASPDSNCSKMKLENHTTEEYRFLPKKPLKNKRRKHRKSNQSNNINRSRDKKTPIAIVRNTALENTAQRHKTNHRNGYHENLPQVIFVKGASYKNVKNILKRPGDFKKRKRHKKVLRRTKRIYNPFRHS